MFEHLDAFTLMAFGWLGLILGSFMVPIHLILQVRHDKEGFGWKEPVAAAVALGVGFGVIVAVGTWLEGAPNALEDGLAVTAVLLPSLLVGGLLGRFLGWLAMRGIGLFNSR